MGEEPIRRLTVSKKEAAKMLGISLRTLDRYIKQNQVRTVRIARRVLVPVEELERIVRGGTHK